MDLKSEIRKLTSTGRSDDAEKLLLDARAQLHETRDSEQLISVLDLLVELYSIHEPRDLAKADRICLERERVLPNAYSKLQTAMLRYWAANDSPGTIEKAQEAIAEGNEEGDHSTVYSAMCLLGMASLQIGDEGSATSVIAGIERMIGEGSKIIVGDEASFLEAAKARGLSVPAIQRIARRLAPVCRDPKFAQRLHALATDR